MLLPFVFSNPRSPSTVSPVYFGLHEVAKSTFKSSHSLQLLVFFTVVSPPDSHYRRRVSGLCNNHRRVLLLPVVLSVRIFKFTFRIFQFLS